MNRFVQLVATNPARIMGLAPQKGSIAIGADADLMLLDREEEKRISTDSLHQHVDYTPFAGISVKGWPKTVMLRGEILVHDGKLLGLKGSGKYIKRKIKIQE